MLSPRMDLGIAQVVFYVPIVPLAIYLFIRNFKCRPRMAWWAFIPLSLIRLAGGVITIVLEKKLMDQGPSTFYNNSSNIGLIIAALVLLNIGAIPLIVAALGQIRIVLMDNYRHNPHSTNLALAIRIFMLVAAALLIAGGAILDSDKTTGRELSIAGYAVFAAALAVVIGMQIFFFSKKSELVPSSRKVLIFGLISAPFMVVRTIYGILEVVNDKKIFTFWDPLFGNIWAFTFMCLFMEYVVVVLYMYLGFSMPPDRGNSQNRLGQESYVAKY